MSIFRRAGAFGGCLLGCLAVVLVALAGAQVGLPASLYVDDGASYYIATWDTLGLPARPDAEYRFASGIGYDPANYGGNVTIPALTTGNAPNLAEGLLAPHQTVNSFDGVLNYLYINDANDLSPGTADFGAMVWGRWTSAATTTMMLAKYDVAADKREWRLGVGTVAGTVAVVISDDGTADAAHAKNYRTSTTWNNGKWHLVGLTWISDALTLYVDGAVETPTITTDGAIAAVYQGTATPTVGCGLNTAAPAYFFPGDIAWAAYWDAGATPTTAEIAALWTAMKPTGTVSLPYSSIQSAVYQGAAGDTVLVQPGLYRETLVVSTAFDAVLAVDNTFGNRPMLLGSELPTAAGTIGLTLSAKNEIGWLDVRGYRTAQGIKADGTSDGSLVHHITIDSCLYAVDFDGACAGDTLANSTIDGSWNTASTGFRATTSTAVTIVALNNVIHTCNVGVTKAAAQTLVGNYNDLFANTTAYSGTSAGSSDLALAPLFRDASGNDYRPKRMSRILNKGVMLHSGVNPFSYLQGAPDIGAWEVAVSRSPTLPGAWARDCPWGRLR